MLYSCHPSNRQVHRLTRRPETARAKRPIGASLVLHVRVRSMARLLPLVAKQPPRSLKLVPVFECRRLSLGSLSPSSPENLVIWDLMPGRKP